jgi:hypothetical protein
MPVSVSAKTLTKKVYPSRANLSWWIWAFQAAQSESLQVERPGTAICIRFSDNVLDSLVEPIALSIGESV